METQLLTAIILIASFGLTTFINKLRLTSDFPPFLTWMIMVTTLSVLLLVMMVFELTQL